MIFSRSGIATHKQTSVLMLKESIYSSIVLVLVNLNIYIDKWWPLLIAYFVRVRKFQPWTLGCQARPVYYLREL